MKQHKLSKEDQKQIAHYIAQRNISHIASGQPIAATKEYLNIFNQTLDILNEYNESAIEL